MRRISYGERGYSAVSGSARALRQRDRSCVSDGRRYSGCRFRFRDAGQTAGKDARDRKPNYVSILGLAASRAQVEQLRNAALAALASLPSSDQKPAHRLAQLADFIAKRAY